MFFWMKTMNIDETACITDTQIVCVARLFYMKIHQHLHENHENTQRENSIV